MSFRLFGLRTQAETGLSDADYAAGKKVFFRLKWRIFGLQLWYMFLVSLVSWAVLSFAWIGGLPKRWDRWALTIFLASLGFALICAVGTFLFRRLPVVTGARESDDQAGV